MVDQERQAERWSYKPPLRKKLDRLIELATINVAVAERRLPQSARIEPQGQVEEVLDRVSIGGGGPVPLFAIQGDPTGKGFISQVPPRFHELRHRYGFCFGHKQDEEKSWYWLLVNEFGTGPKMNSVGFAEAKTGIPKPLRSVKQSGYRVGGNQHGVSPLPQFCSNDKVPAQQSLFGNTNEWRDPETAGER